MKRKCLIICQAIFCIQRVICVIALNIVHCYFAWFRNGLYLYCCVSFNISLCFPECQYCLALRFYFYFLICMECLLWILISYSISLFRLIIVDFQHFNFLTFVLLYIHVHVFLCYVNLVVFKIYLQYVYLRYVYCIDYILYYILYLLYWLCSCFESVIIFSFVLVFLFFYLFICNVCCDFLFLIR